MPEQVSPPPPTGGPVSGPEPAENAVDRRARRRRSLIEWGSILVVAVVAAILLRSFVIQPYFIPSGSMEPTLHIGDKVLVDKLSYHLHGVHRGDVIVFNKPTGDYDPGIKVLIKRVIGLPGETISAHNGDIYIDGKELAQPWLPKGDTTADFGPDYIPKGCYFVMGDNRGNSEDSRVVGCIPRHLIIGRAFLIVWPPSQIGTL